MDVFNSNKANFFFKDQYRVLPGDSIQLGFKKFLTFFQAREEQEERMGWEPNCDAHDLCKFILFHDHLLGTRFSPMQYKPYQYKAQRETARNS